MVWSPTALRHIEQIFAYLVEFNPHAAERLVNELVAAGDRLEHLAYRGRLVPGTNVRELTVVYPFILRYEIMQEAVAILRVRHGKRSDDVEGS